MFVDKELVSSFFLRHLSLKTFPCNVSYTIFQFNSGTERELERERILLSQDIHFCPFFKFLVGNCVLCDLRKELMLMG